MIKSNPSFEYLYCFDDNFNKQAFTSIISLLDNVKKPIVINVIHPNQFVYDKVPDLINKHINLKKINFFLFKIQDINFQPSRQSCLKQLTIGFLLTSI